MICKTVTIIKMWSEDTLHLSCLSLMGIGFGNGIFYVAFDNQSCHNSHIQNAVGSQTQVNRIAHEQAMTCKQFFAGLPLSSRP